MRLIMLSAMYENGGNTTHRMLDGHPELLVYPFESQVGTGVGSDYLSSFVPIRYRWPEFPMNGTPEQDYERFWDEELKTYLRVRSRSKFRECGLEMDEDERRRHFAEWIERHGRTRRTIVEAFFHSTFEAWSNLARTGSEQAWVGYNPVQILDYEKFFEDFPDGHMIHVVRHPEAGYSDTKKRPFPLSLSRYAWTWNHSQHMALVAKRQFPDQVHIMRYEDMAESREKGLGDVLRAIGLEWSDRCDVPTFNSRPLDEVKPWGTIRTPTLAVNEETRDELSAGERRELMDLTSVMFDLIYADRFAPLEPAGAGH